MPAADLHVHSNRSDGTLSPRELVDYAVEKGLAAFALTDHDTTEGLDEALQYAELLRTGAIPCPKYIEPEGSRIAVRKSPRDVSPPGIVPEVIPGIELSAEYEGHDVHIVGLFINYHNTVFQNRLREFTDARIARNRKMCALLQKAGIPVTWEALCAEFPDAVITRAHYAKYMFGRGYVKSMSEAFERYIGDDCPCYLPREKITPVQAVEMILSAEGAPILAHPVQYKLNENQLETLTARLKEAGLIGLEAVYSTHTAADERRMRALAARHGLLVSGGSDFHGSNKPGLDLGTGYGNLRLPLSVVEDIRRAVGS